MITKAMRFVLRRPVGDDGGENGGGQATGADVNAANTKGADDDASAAAAAIEAEATQMGWTSKDQFKGDPDKWRPADEYLERGKKMLPIIQASNKRLERQVAELQSTVKDFAAHMSTTEQRAFDRALASLKEQRAAAIEAGDGKAFAEVDDAIDQLKTDAKTKAAKAAPASAADDPVYAEWEARNPWLKDPKMSAYGESAAEFLRKTGETAIGAEFLDLVTKEVKSRFPDKFTNPRRDAAASVEGGQPAPRKGGKDYASMPADARAACDRMAKNGYSGDAKAMADFKANYVKQYFEEA